MTRLEIIFKISLLLGLTMVQISNGQINDTTTDVASTTTITATETTTTEAATTTAVNATSTAAATTATTAAATTATTAAATTATAAATVATTATTATTTTTKSSNSTSSGNATTSTKTASYNATTAGPITIGSATLAEWDRQDKQEMITGIGMGIGVLASLIVVAVIVICVFCKGKVDRHQKYLEKVAEAKKQIEMKTRRERMLQRAPGISNELVTGYAGGMRDAWDPFNF